MASRRLILLAFLGFAALLAGAWAITAYTPGGASNPAAPQPARPEPLVRAAAPPPRLKPPVDTLLLLPAQGEVKAPFVLRAQPEAAGGVVLDLPQGSGTPEREGRVRLPFELKAAGAYRAWAHVRWSDNCGNSLALRIGGEPERTAGNDQIYGEWHWVPAGEYDLAAGAHELWLLEREDGIAVDQVLLTTDPEYAPLGRLAEGREDAAVRRFADAFDRSPGHGLGDWEPCGGAWKIEFSLDPNRIPNQYALAGGASGGRALNLARTPAWPGCRLSCAYFPQTGSRGGAVLDWDGDGARALWLGFAVGEAGANASTLKLEGAGAPVELNLGATLRAGQWHRLEIERWAWTLRVFLDGREVLARHDLEPRAGRMGLFLDAGNAVFDDVEAEELAWQADDGQGYRIDWEPAEGAEWARAGRALEGRAGRIHARHGDWPVQEVVLEEDPASAGGCGVRTEGLLPLEPHGSVRAWRRDPVAAPAADLELAPEREPARVRRVAARFGPDRRETEAFGPYAFSEAALVDPSDYLDFTPEEFERIRASPEAEKLRRREKTRPVLGGKSGDQGFWRRYAGSWKLEHGALAGKGQDAEIRHAFEAIGDLELSLKVRLDRKAEAELFLYALDGEPGVRVRFGAPSDAELALPVPADRKWHEVVVRVRNETLEASCAGAPPARTAFRRGDGGAMGLRVLNGEAAFDDILIARPRHSERGGYYPFVRRETGWWREGGAWLDHGGIACVLASSWISLVAPNAEGLLWSKREFKPDLLVAFNVEENTEWYGWDKHPSHTHYPYDNLSVVLAPEQDAAQGYKLVVNAENRTATVLYREGREVARAAQDEAFPLRYVGGHAPFQPRICRIALAKHGAALCAIVNGKVVLEFDDPRPLPVRRVGLGGSRTRANFSQLEIREAAEELPVEKKEVSARP